MNVKAKMDNSGSDHVEVSQYSGKTLMRLLWVTERRTRKHI